MHMQKGPDVPIRLIRFGRNEIGSKRLTRDQIALWREELNGKTRFVYDADGVYFHPLARQPIH